MTKELIAALMICLALICVFSSCKEEEKIPTISVEDGYVAVNGVKTEYKAHTDPSISVIDGYIAIDGVKTEYKAEVGCEHDWDTVTTPPTCTADGYDILTCKVCKKSVRANLTDATSHKFPSSYTTDNEYHWLSCTACDEIKDKAQHSLDDEGICTVCKLPLSDTPDIIYDISDDKTYAMVIGYIGTATKIKIAEEYNGIPVKSIYREAFRGNEKITAVIIPEGVTSIGDSAFSSCTSLTSVIIPTGVTSIGSYAFYGCKSLTSVSIPEGVTSIGSYAFYGCKSLTSVSIPEGVASIGDGAFHGCTSLSSVSIPEGVTNIGNRAFYNCTSLSSVSIPEGVTSIGYHAFDSCKSLTSVSIPSSVTNICSCAFYYCTSLKSITYGGTKAEWNSIEKDSTWNSSTGLYAIYCKDGNIMK